MIIEKLDDRQMLVAMVHWLDKPALTIYKSRLQTGIMKYSKEKDNSTPGNGMKEELLSFFAGPPGYHYQKWCLIRQGKDEKISDYTGRFLSEYLLAKKETSILNEQMFIAVDLVQLSI